MCDVDAGEQITTTQVQKRVPWYASLEVVHQATVCTVVHTISQVRNQTEVNFNIFYWSLSEPIQCYAPCYLRDVPREPTFHDQMWDVM